MRISAVLLVLAAASPLGAQGTPESIPVPLVTALASGGQSLSEHATYSVGELPAGWPAELSLPGRAVVGGVADGRLLIAVFADSGRRPLAEFLTRLQRAGFSHPPERAGSGFMNGGGPYDWFCRDSAVVAADMAPSPRGRLYMRVTYRSLGRAGCETAVPTPPRSTSTLTLPELPPPSGLNDYGAGGGASEREVSSYGLLGGTSVSPAAMLVHYARLLTAAGWTAGGSVSDSTSAAQLFLAHDESGRPWQGVLTVFTTATGRNVNLVMKPEGHQ